jgi:hypothetical protein
MSEVRSAHMRDNEIDLGSGHWFRWTTLHENKATPYSLPDEPNIAGLIERHVGVDGKVCEGYVPFADTGQDGRPCWTVESLNPLTLSPSLQCTVCPSHGWIREGRWVE